MNNKELEKQLNEIKKRNQLGEEKLVSILL